MRVPALLAGVVGLGAPGGDPGFEGGEGAVRRILLWLFGGSHAVDRRSAELGLDPD